MVLETGIESRLLIIECTAMACVYIIEVASASAGSLLTTLFGQDNEVGVELLLVLYSIGFTTMSWKKIKKSIRNLVVVSSQLKKVKEKEE